MDRRQFLMSLSATSVAGPAFAGMGTIYTEGMVVNALEQGDTVFIDFFAPWCSTCRVQELRVNELRAENPDYEKHLTFISVNWDDHSRSDLARRLEIPRRSTLVAIKGRRVLGRIVAQTSKRTIQQLLDKALEAAVA